MASITVTTNVEACTDILSVNPLTPSGTLFFQSGNNNAYFTCNMSHSQVYPSGILCAVTRTPVGVVSSVAPSGTTPISSASISNMVASGVRCVLPSPSSRLLVSYSIGGGASQQAFVSPSSLVNQIGASGITAHMSTVLAGLLKMQIAGSLPIASSVISNASSIASALNASVVSTLQNALQSTTTIASLIQASSAYPIDAKAMSWILASDLIDFYVACQVQLTVTYSLYNKTQTVKIENVPLYLMLTTTPGNQLTYPPSPYLPKVSSMVGAKQYPPISLDANEALVAGAPHGNGTYLVYASSSSSNINCLPFNAFDGLSTTEFICPEIDPSTGEAAVSSSSYMQLADGRLYKGGWLTLELPREVPVEHIGIRSLTLGTAPTSYVVLGRTWAEYTWHVLHEAKHDYRLSKTRNEVSITLQMPQTVKC